MSLPDTAEYWWDVKSRSARGGNPMVFHDPDFICDNPKREFHCDAEYLEDMNCSKCKRNAKEHGTKLQSSKCECGKQMVERINKSNGNKFLGCSDYPKCKKTKSILRSV